MNFDFLVIRFFFFFACRKPNCGLYIVFVVSFVSCIRLHDEQKLFALFSNLSFFSFADLFFYSQHENCTFYGTQKINSLQLVWSWSTWPNSRFSFFPWSQRSEWKCWIRWASVLLWWKCDICCLNSCMLFFYQTLGLSFSADHQCCHCPSNHFVYSKHLIMTWILQIIYIWVCINWILVGT